jgi:hypothetical protein
VDQPNQLCSDFYVNQRLALKMDLPETREPTLELFDRMRKSFPELTRVRRGEDEVALESDEARDDFLWVSLRRTSIRSGHASPPSLQDAYRIHRAVLETAPWFLSISPLDIEHIDLTFGFDLETDQPRDSVVFDALLAASPLAGLVDGDLDHPVDVQPFLGMSLSPSGNLMATFEVKTRPRGGDAVKTGFAEPISVYLTVRRNGPLASLEELPGIFATLCGHAERLAEERAIPHLVMPIREAIAAR